MFPKNKTHTLYFILYTLYFQFTDNFNTFESVMPDYKEYC